MRLLEYYQVSEAMKTQYVLKKLCLIKLKMRGLRWKYQYQGKMGRHPVDRTR